MLALEFALYVKHVEVIERHAMPITSEDEHTIPNNCASMTITSRWTLALSLRQGFIIVILRQTGSFSFLYPFFY